MRARRPDSAVQLPVLAVPASGNAKTGLVSATYVTGSTCPESCPFRKNGCYGEDGLVALQSKRLNRAPVQDPATVGRLEADMIDALPALLDLRLHVYGEFADEAHAREVAAAAGRYVARGRIVGRTLKVWTYTHRWREIPVEAFGPDINVLASCETYEDAELARVAGYAPAVVVPEFESDRPYASFAASGEELKTVPCPNQTAGRQCVDCRLCLNAARLLKNRQVIAFRPNKNKTQRIALETIRRELFLAETE